MTYSESFIASEYRRLGHTLGWRFLTCPERNIDTASVALITINPGGNVFEPPRWSVEDGSAYVIESWKGRAPGEENLQRQVRRMFELMALDPADVLSGYFVPFRSRRWKDLPRKPEALALGFALWREVFERAHLRTVVAFGKKEIGPDLVQVLNALPSGTFSANWGNQTIDTYRFGHAGTLLVLPHLSTYKLFSRPISTAAFQLAMSGSVQSVASLATLPGERAVRPSIVPVTSFISSSRETPICPTTKAFSGSTATAMP